MVPLGVRRRGGGGSPVFERGEYCLVGLEQVPKRQELRYSGEVVLRYAWNVAAVFVKW